VDPNLPRPVARSRPLIESDPKAPAKPIPAFDLGRAAHRIERVIAERWKRLRDETCFIGGEEVVAFEEAYARYVGTAGCVGVANGTDALELALRALRLKRGEEVIVPSFSFIATAAAVSIAGGVPVFADVEPDTLNISVSNAASKVTDRTAGIIAVHLFGRPCALDNLQELCRRNSLWLIEDAAQAHGASFNGRRVGSFGELAAWSFYPSKNLGCFGDGGAVTGQDEGLVERVRRLANHGRIGHYLHATVGRNSRLDAVQASVLNSRLPLLEKDNHRRRQIAGIYRGELAGVGDLKFLKDSDGSLPVYHQFTVRTARRDALRECLRERSIGSSIHYPRPIHQQPAYKELAKDAQLPVSEAASQDVLSLPMFPELTEEEVERVCAAIRSFYG
jgi:dTDP-4-amino-4,6-dideoxygalactose transaminase